ncbi:MAG: M28 family peptidase [Tangfeifania sp.]
MILNKCFIPALLLLMLVNFGHAQQKVFGPVHENNLRKHVSYLAADSLQGRKPGTPGLKIAARYLRRSAKEAGLKPGAPNYFQHFELISARPDMKNSFLKIPGAGNYLSDSLICMNQNNKLLKISGEVVLAGFGHQDEKNGYNDLEGVKIDGKIVVCSTGSPELFKKNSSFRWNNRLEQKKTERLFEKGALAVVFVTNPKDSTNRAFNQIYMWMNRERYSLKPDTVSADKKIFVTIPGFADHLLGEKNSWKNYLTEIVDQNKPAPGYPENAIIEIQSSHNIKIHETQNVVGMLEGSHPELKNECVVYMAHYDHLGTDSEGDIYNGADDNASGCAALLEIAKIFQQPEFQPRRSILFLWATGEEYGLLGSGYYANHPVFPMKNTAACINLDMIGRVYEPRDSVWKNSPKLVKDFDGIYTLVSDFNPKLTELTDSVSKELGLIPDKSLPEYFFRSSDHYHFHSRNVPIVNLATGYHADYHKVTDKVSRIRYDKLKRVTELSFWIGHKMAGN